MDKSIVPALLALIGTLTAGFLSTFLSDHYKRFRDRASLAGALAGELASYREGWPLLAQQIPVLLDATRAGHTVRLPKIEKPIDRVFESCVAQIGLLGPELAEEVAYVYNNLNAFRVALLSAGSDDMQAPMQSAVLEGAWAALNRAQARGESLPAKLSACANENYATKLPHATALLAIFISMLIGAFFLGGTFATGQPTQARADPVAEAGGQRMNASSHESNSPAQHSATALNEQASSPPQVPPAKSRLTGGSRGQ